MLVGGFSLRFNIDSALEGRSETQANGRPTKTSLCAPLGNRLGEVSSNSSTMALHDSLASYVGYRGHASLDLQQAVCAGGGCPNKACLVLTPHVTGALECDAHVPTAELRRKVQRQRECVVAQKIDEIAGWKTGEGY